MIMHDLFRILIGRKEYLRRRKMILNKLKRIIFNL
jgi:hypothetical protein